MTITARLRQIAERLDANETERMVILAEIRELSTSLGFDSPAPSLTPETAPGAGTAPRVTVGPLPATEREGTPVERGASQTTRLSRAPSTGSSTVPCPDCDRTFAARGLNIHRAKHHGIHAGQTAPVAALSPEDEEKVGRHPDEPSLRDFLAEDAAMRKETFLCSRCPMSFATREKLREHETKDHVDPPRTLPVGTVRRSEQERLIRGETARVLHRGGA